MSEMSERELLSAILTAVQTIEAKVTSLDERFTFLEGDVSKIKNDVSDIKNTQERHERILELLSLKTIEHEAYIRDHK